METDRKPRGRPMDEELGARVLSATWALLAEKSLSELTLNEIASAAGTSRPALYRRWNSVEAIVIDAFLAMVEDEVPTPGIAEPALALREYIVSLARFLQGRVGRVIAELLGRAQSDEALMAAFHQGFLVPRRNHARALIARGQAAGVFRSDLDLDLIIDLYAGPIYFRAFSKHAALDGDFADGLARLVTHTLRPPRPAD
ncbi:TetR/AcrR family transcriptional regulator [Paracoccus sp. PXZ]